MRTRLGCLLQTLSHNQLYASVLLNLQLLQDLLGFIDAASTLIYSVDFVDVEFESGGEG